MFNVISNKITVILLKTERLKIWYKCDQVAFWEFIILLHMLQEPLCVVFRSVSYSITSNRIYMCLTFGVCSNVLHQRDNQENISQYSRISSHSGNIFSNLPSGAMPVKTVVIIFWSKAAIGAIAVNLYLQSSFLEESKLLVFLVVDTLSSTKRILIQFRFGNRIIILLWIL